ncbi:MAG TPA: aminotransferase class III-fold pyridoxal phosphate-dependent enzyme [Streptosporangiaceae bacterium]|nr:aminotransferase class III-fold pyridoxal phosphate-dependent enzyme [Streptosporangiaceae bacterium]
MTEVISQHRIRSADTALRERARAVIPGGMYGHLSAARLPAQYPQFYQRAEGAHVWDADGNEYVDFMCSFGPIVLGYGHPKVEQAAAAQRAKGDTMSGPGPVIVDLAELLTGRVGHADWAIFAKNGTDATTVCLMVARAATGRATVLAAAGAYHGAVPWFNNRPDGATPQDHANFRYFRYNDIASVEQAAKKAGGDVAAIIASPFKHDAGFDQEMVRPEFARGLRTLCDRIGAALVIDEVRAGFRVHDGGSWEPIGVAPDLSAWSKSIANGYPLAAVLGSAAYAEAAARIFVTGSFWFQAVPMAAAVATITAIREEGAVPAMIATGRMLREGLEQAAAEAGVRISQTGPVQIPNLSFRGDADYARALAFCATAAEHGVIFHPRHNWFISAAHTPSDVERAVAAARAGFRVVRERFAAD